MEEKYGKNILLFYLISIFSGLAFTYDLILVIYYQSFGLTFSQISFIAVLTGIFVLIFEVPSGAYADIYGKKKSLLVGSLAFLLSFIIIILSDSFLLFLLAGAIFGLSLAFNSGSYNALIYDSLRGMGRKKDYLKINSRMEAIFLATTILTAFMGPYLYSINKLFPLYVTVVFGLLSLLVIFMLHDPVKKRKQGKFVQKHVKQIKEGFAFSIRRPKIVWLIAFTALFAFVGESLAEILEVPYLLDLGFVVRQVAVIEVIALIVQVILTWKSDYIEKKLGEDGAFLAVILVVSSSLFLTRFIGNYFIGILMGLFWGGMQFRELISDNYLNHHLRKENRATVLSISSMTSAVAAIIILPIFGLVADISSTVFSIGLVSAVCLFGGLVLYGIKKGKGF